MPRSIGPGHIARQDDGTVVGIWGGYTLKSAFQPIFAFREGRLLLSAYEGLIRPFRNEQPVGPGVFFASIPDIDRLQVETLARTLHLLNGGANLSKTASLFVNFDPSHFVDAASAASALRDVQGVIKEAGISAERVVCEITEQETGSDETLIRFVRALKGYGHRVAVDDYGADSSDLKRIEALGPDIVKFDGAWTGRLLASAPGIAMLTDMVRSFAQKGIRTVFEGIETGQQLELAESCGVSMVQGFALARPQLAPGAFAEFEAARESERRRVLADAVENLLQGKLESTKLDASANRSGRTFGRRGT
ncbi:EAL domain-containing protein [Nitratireductor kimnyeongensis]|uniref:EAL domain-containing protein n=1 Tax=Nitratireductor kimnyeongensis TaxID=430679 RepID=A0ABW0T8J1_9HYPH|nr:EAL domain-containing protein [Nitratireductor kimnyeongensis]QZZ36030.1 EAL domain-containing protein [Nitratireductor kimnyeongensis]